MRPTTALGIGKRTNVDGNWPLGEVIVWVPTGCKVEPMDAENKSIEEDPGGDRRMDEIKMSGSEADESNGHADKQRNQTDARQS